MLVVDFGSMEWRYALGPIPNNNRRIRRRRRSKTDRSDERQQLMMERRNLSGFLIGVVGTAITLSAYSQSIFTSTQCIAIGLIVLMLGLLVKEGLISLWWWWEDGDHHLIINMSSCYVFILIDVWTDGWIDRWYTNTHKLSIPPNSNTFLLQEPRGDLLYCFVLLLLLSCFFHSHSVWMDWME